MRRTDAAEAAGGAGPDAPLTGQGPGALDVPAGEARIEQRACRGAGDVELGPFTGHIEALEAGAAFQAIGGQAAGGDRAGVHQAGGVVIDAGLGPLTQSDRFGGHARGRGGVGRFDHAGDVGAQMDVIVAAVDRIDGGADDVAFRLAELGRRGRAHHVAGQDAAEVPGLAVEEGPDAGAAVAAGDAPLQFRNRRALGEQLLAGASAVFQVRRSRPGAHPEAGGEVLGLPAGIFDPGLVQHRRFGAAAAEVAPDRAVPVAEGGEVEAEAGAAEVGARTQVVGGGQRAHVIVGRVELHDRAQRHLELAVRAGDGRPAVGEGDLGRGRLVLGHGGLGVGLRHLGGLDGGGVGAELRPQLPDLARQRLDLGLELLEPGLARIDRRRALLGRRGGNRPLLGQSRARSQQGERARGDTRQQPRPRGHLGRNHLIPLVLGSSPALATSLIYNA